MMGKHVFISYQRTDQPRAVEIAGALTAFGLPVFVDLQIRAGDLWDADLEQAMNKAFAVVCIWTPDSVQSRWVRLEARYGLRLGMLCPVLRQACDIPLEFSDVEHADLRHWQEGDDDHPEWRNLVDSLMNFQQSGSRIRPNSEADLSFRLGIRFLDGINCPKDLAMALSWLRKAQDLGHERARDLLKQICTEP